MSLLKSLNFGPTAKLYIWKLEETLTELRSRVILHKSDLERYSKISHPEKQGEFLALRCCLREHFGTNPEVFYHQTGKPYLDRSEKISFSHTHGYSAALISEELEVGLDLELYRPGIKKVARKYMRADEIKSLDDTSEVEHLLYYWGAKEVMVKITGNRRLDFKKQLRVRPFSYKDFQNSSGGIYDAEHPIPVRIFFCKIDALYISLGWEWSW